VSLYELDTLTSIEMVGRNRVAQEMNMAVSRREIGECGVAAEEGVDLDLSDDLGERRGGDGRVGSCLKKVFASGSYVSQATLRRRTSP
jgi:hypothetical protein